MYIIVDGDNGEIEVKENDPTPTVIRKDRPYWYYEIPTGDDETFQITVQLRDIKGVMYFYEVLDNMGYKRNNLGANER